MAEGKKRIAIVDDESDIRAVARALLGRYYVVAEGKTGKEALKLVDENPDLALLILDNTMPEMNGLEALRVIKEERKNTTLPILMLSADYNVKEAIEKYRKDYGRVPECMGKPYANKALVAKAQEMTK